MSKYMKLHKCGIAEDEGRALLAPGPEEWGLFSGQRKTTADVAGKFGGLRAALQKVVAMRERRGQRRFSDDGGSGIGTGGPHREGGPAVSGRAEEEAGKGNKRGGFYGGVVGYGAPQEHAIK